MLKDKINNGNFVTTVELSSPRGTKMNEILEDINILKGKIDAVNICDCPMATMRMSPIATAHIIQNELGVESIFHLTCRDRNLIGLQSELLGAYALGIRNVLAITGDTPKAGDHPQATGVFDVDGVGLVGILNTLNQGINFNGKELDGGTDFLIGSVANPNASDLEKEVSKTLKKISAGAQFIQTQPVYNIENAEKFFNVIYERSEKKVHFILGIMPLKSSKMAINMNNRIPDINIPDDIIKSLENGKTGIEISLDVIKALKRYVRGVHIMPMSKMKTALELIDEIEKIK